MLLKLNTLLYISNNDDYKRETNINFCYYY